MNRRTESDRAKHLIVHYFQVLAEHSGMTWDTDYTAELEEAVDAIIEAAAYQSRNDWDNYIKAEAMK